MKEADPIFEEYIEIIGAEEHNLKQINVSIPRNKMTVITGVSGSGKSSLAFDTIYAEGQRRYMETLSSYARQFIAQLDRPKVEQITGLSPVISIEQKRGGWNPRSTVGTITEVYDFMRLLYARIGEAFSHISGEKMIKFTEEQIIRHLSEQFEKKKIVILAPLIKGRKGHYRELFDQVRKQGYTKVRINGAYEDLIQGMKLDRYKTHDIELVIDRLEVGERKKNRLSESLKSALRMGKNTLLIEEVEASKVFTFSKKLMDPETGISYEEPSPNSFSFNSPYGACSTCKGLGTVNRVDMDKVIPDDTKSINQIGIAPFGEVRDNYTFKQLRAIARKYKFTFSAPIKDIPEEAMSIILNGGDEKFEAKFEKFKHDFVYNLAYEGLTNMLQRWYTETTSESIRSWAERFMSIKPCDTCHGARLRFESLQFKIHDKTISDLAQMDLSELNNWFLHLDPHLSKRQKQIGNELIKEIRYRLGFLVQLGLGYLQADRPARTLSGGETQRTRLATQIGSQLSGITYILDEPSIGLHQRDNHRLIEALHGLTEIGNTVIVVEHDKDIMMSSDYLIDLGPGAGKNGGEVVATGSPNHVKQTNSLTSAYLRKTLNIEIPKVRRKSNGQAIVLTGASGNNLDDISVRFPLGLMICVTGVSGSGKSTLISETLYPILRQHLYGSIQNPLPYEKIEGLDLIDKIIEIDQKPIGRTPRSNPATYTNVFTEIRKLYAKVPEAMIRGYKPGRFSFNVKGGRCEICKGSGKKLIEMNFLPNVYVDCDNCHGKRYNRETLEIIYKGKSISDVLDMSTDEGVEFFANIPKIFNKLKTIQEVGLGYITLGQQATTLSGGEAQRVKLAEELSKRATGKTLYILDEPTTGLHFQDIVHLLEVLGKLTDKGNTVIIIEHNIDVIKVADYIVDLGPGGGREGGNIVVSGTPEEVVKLKSGYTWEYLAEEL